MPPLLAPTRPQIYLERSSVLQEAPDEPDIPSIIYNVSPHSPQPPPFTPTAAAPHGRGWLRRPAHDASLPGPAHPSSPTASPSPPFPLLHPQFKKLAELEMLEAGAIVDVVGVVESVDPWNVITRKVRRHLAALP